jgi:hypothetical protein
MNAILLLVASLALNAVLLGAVMRKDRAGSGPQPPPHAPEEANRGTDPTSNAAAPGPEAAPSSGTNGTGPFHWSQLDTSDWFAYRDGLVQIGCPAATIRDILEPLVARHYSELCRERLRPFVDEFWERYRPPNQAAREAVEAEVARIEVEERDVLDRLFGALPAQKSGPAAPRPQTARQLDFLPEDLHPEVVQRLTAHRSRLRKTAETKFPTAEDQSKAYQDLREQFTTELSEILSPDQLDELMLRRSPLARFRKIDGHDMNEAELWEVIRRAESTATPEDARHDGYVPPQREQQAMEAVLGSERAESLQRAEQSEFQKLLKMTRRLELPETRAVDVWKAQEAVTDAIQKVSHDSTLTHPERRAQVQQLRESLARQVEGMLGGARGRETWEHALRQVLENKFQVPNFDPVSALESP